MNSEFLGYSFWKRALKRKNQIFFRQSYYFFEKHWNPFQIYRSTDASSLNMLLWDRFTNSSHPNSTRKVRNPKKINSYKHPRYCNIRICRPLKNETLHFLLDIFFLYNIYLILFKRIPKLTSWYNSLQC